MIEVSNKQITKIKAQLDRGLFLKAYEESRHIGPIAEWDGTDACICAGRLALNLGGQKLSHILFRRSYRRYPESLKAYTYELQRTHESYGPVAALRFLQTVAAPKKGQQADRLHLLIAKSLLFAIFRDFTSADRLLTEAEQIDQAERSVLLQRSILFELEDKYESALEYCNELLRRHPDFLSGISRYAHLLLLQNRHSEALTFLSKNTARFESFLLYVQIVHILMELEKFEECTSYLPEITRLAPLKEKSLDKWLTGTEFRVAYCTGNFERAGEIAETLKDQNKPEYLRILSSGTPPKRVCLSVPYVRQHHDTCAPATLSALTGYWGRQISHDRIVESICYTGTPPHRIRDWATENGWFLREFTLTWEVARGLVDRRIPFAVEIAEPVGKHLHAVIGYDEIRRTLLIRDPSIYFTLEVEADKYLKRYAGSGPMALVVVPMDKKDLLEKMQLPGAEMYDLLFGIRKALSSYDHRQALKLLKRLKTRHPYCQVTSAGFLSMAVYDHSTTSMRKTLERHLEIYPNDHNALFHLLASYNELGMADKRRSRLKDLCHTDIHPVFFRERARDLIGRDPEKWEALYWLKRSARAQPRDPECLKLYADLLWAQREFEEAQMFYRLAVTVEDKYEIYIPPYLAASRYLKKTEEVIELLKKRVSLYGGKSTRPLTSLVIAYTDMDQVNTGFEALESGLGNTPEDGELLTFAAQMWAAYGRVDEARSCLEASKKVTERVRWYRSSAIVEHYSGNKKESLKSWQAILSLDPANVEAHTFVSQLLREMKGSSAALEHLEKICGQFPHHVELNRLWLSQLAEQDVARMERVALRLLEVYPAETWVHRALVTAMQQRGQYDEAERYLKEAVRIEPNNPENHQSLGSLYSEWGKIKQARRAFQRSLTLRVDTTEAIKGLFSLASSVDEKAAAVEFVRAGLVAQTINGEGLVAFHEIAKAIVDPDVLLATLRQANMERPDLWQTWSVLTVHYISMDLLDEAEACARQASDRFPLLSPVWMYRSKVHLIRGCAEEEREAVETAHELTPAWSVPSQRLFVLYIQDGQFDQAALVIGNACAHAPLDPVNHGMYAHVLQLQNRNKEAYRELRQALYLDPSYDFAWSALQSLSIKEGKPDRPSDLLWRFLQERPNDPTIELRLAESWLFRDYQDRAKSGLQELITKNPHFIPAYDLLARIHAWKGEYEKAMNVCTPDGFDPVPMQLQLRRASILIEKKDYELAVKDLESILEHDRESLICWRLLLDSLWNLSLYEALAEKAKSASFLFPFDEFLRGRLGDAHLKLGNPEPARRSFERAFALDRSFVHAGVMLFDLELQRGKIECAEGVLSLLEKHAGRWHSEIVARTVHLAVKKNNEERAATLFRSLCLAKLDNSQSLERTISAIEQAGLQEKMWLWLSGIIADERINPFAANRWAEISARKNVDAWLPKLRRINVLLRTGADVVKTVTDGLYEALINSIRERKELVYIEHKQALHELFRRYYMTLVLYPGTWSRIVQGMLFCGYIGKAYAKVKAWNSFMSINPQIISAVVSTYYLYGKLQRAKSALEDLEYRASRSEATEQQRQVIDETFRVFERLLSRGYGQATDDVFPQDSSDPSFEFLHCCARFIAGLHGDASSSRDRGRGIVEDFLAAYPESWYMKPVFHFILKQHRKKRYS
jgi:tetratricopeptide (TPR) repeat protein